MKDQIETDQAIPNILVVDDVPANLKLLDDILKYEGYKTRPVPNGELALRAAEKEKPDLILLDIMMPGIDGFEVCRRLKENPELKDIPVIFISALGDTGNILKAFAVGGVDYINKPFQTAEVKPRVQTHLKMHRQSRELRELNATLEFKVEERTRDLQDANRVKGEFLARASHEMRTPMNAILGFAQLLNMGELSPNQKKGINHILTSGKHLLGLINDVLDLSNIDTGRLPLLHEPVMLAEVVEEAVETVRPLAIARQINLEFVNPAASRLFVMSDRKRLNQALMNLLTNAVKYNREAGAIFVKTEMRPMNDTDIVSARISVTDTGWGISPEDIPKLFMPFERIGAEKTQTEGVGVGLALVKKIMDALEGTVGVESIVGKGSTFWIDLPIAGNQHSLEEQKEDNTKLTAAPAKTGTILYIEDNARNAELVQEIIGTQRPGIRLIISMYGKPAVKLATDNQPDLILLDLNLPDITGTEVLENLLADDHTKSIPVVVVTADATQKQIGKLMASGARTYLTKPLDILLFLEVVDEWITAGK